VSSVRRSCDANFGLRRVCVAKKISWIRSIVDSSSTGRRASDSLCPTSFNRGCVGQTNPPTALHLAGTHHGSLTFDHGMMDPSIHHLQSYLLINRHYHLLPFTNHQPWIWILPSSTWPTLSHPTQNHGIILISYPSPKSPPRDSSSYSIRHEPCALSSVPPVAMTACVIAY
jgi:hypothetical protein